MAIAYRKRVNDNTEFALWKIEEDDAELYSQLQLNETEKAYVEKLSRGKRYLHWLGTRVLLRKMLQTTEYIDCRIDEHGKPYLPHMPYHISLSHSFDYAAVMVSRDKPVGIDIEQVAEKIERVAHKFMDDKELGFINPQNNVDQLYVCWCAKEAVYKCYGKTEISFLDNILLQPFDYNKEGLIKAKLQKDAIGINYNVHYMKYEGYMIGYVVEEQ